MSISGRYLSCSLDGLTPISREEQRIAAIKRLDLLNISSVPVLDEATQMVARFLASPISIITLMVDQEVSIKAAFGLSSLGLLNSLATLRTMPRSESLCAYVVDSKQPLAIEDTLSDPVFSESILVYKYNIRSYLGVPLIFQDICIGTLAVMSLSPFCYNQNSLEYLLLVSRWCLQEIEMGHLKKTLSLQSSNSCNLDSTKHLQVIHQFGEELRNPLTSIVGMTSILVKGVLGTFTSRQEEYLNIIYTSSQHLNILLDELLNLITLPKQNNNTKLSLVNLEMLCQKVIQGVTPIANRKQQTLRCYTNNLELIFPLDRDKIHQALSYLIFVILILSPAETFINIHLYCGDQKAVIFLDFPTGKFDYLASENNHHHPSERNGYLTAGLELSRALILSHGGTLSQEKLIQTSDTSYERYIISLPKMN